MAFPWRKERTGITFAKFRLEDGIGRAESIAERCRTDTVMERIPVNIADCCSNMAYSAKLDYELFLLSQPSLPVVFSIEIARISVSSKKCQLRDVVGLCTKVVVGGHYGVGESAGFSPGNRDGKTVHIIDVVFF
jgi:hypothetical protein